MTLPIKCQLLDDSSVKKFLGTHQEQSKLLATIMFCFTSSSSSEKLHWWMEPDLWWNVKYSWHKSWWFLMTGWLWTYNHLIIGFTIKPIRLAVFKLYLAWQQVNLLMLNPSHTLKLSMDKAINITFIYMKAIWHISRDLQLNWTLNYLISSQIWSSNIFFWCTFPDNTSLPTDLIVSDKPCQDGRETQARISMCSTAQSNFIRNLTTIRGSELPQ